jgi:hypothetical protein
MNLITATCAAALLLLSPWRAEAQPIDWIERARAACSLAGDPPTSCERGISLIRQAMGAARGASSGTNGSGGNVALLAAAEAVAAYVVLERLYPDQRADLEARLAVALADIEESQAKADALARGRRAATEPPVAAR